MTTTPRPLQPGDRVRLLNPYGHVPTVFHTTRIQRIVGDVAWVDWYYVTFPLSEMELIEEG